MELLKNKEEWDAIKPTLLKRFNISFGEVRGEPAEYPCLIKPYPCSDVNGYNIHVIYLYKKDAAKLLNAVDYGAPK